MKDNDFDIKFPWTIALIGCSIVYFAFARFMKLLNIILPPVFMWTGVVSFLLGCLSGIITFLFRKKQQLSEE